MSIGEHIMENKFEEALKSTLNNETTISENGAVMFATSGKKLVDLNFATSSLRNASQVEIEKMFSDAFFENELLATKWLFFARDIRGNGMGERRLFRICFSWLANTRPELVKKLIPLVATYGRFDDILNCGLEGELWDSVGDYIAETFRLDLDACNEGKPISLLAKWMPSCNTSSCKTKALAKKLRQALGMDEKTYRKNLSVLRAKLKLVEVDASANNWSMIDYNAVPSQANLKYKLAFMKHDAERRIKYLADLEKPESGAKINSSASFPCDIVSKYVHQNSQYCYEPKFSIDPTLEAMWKALPDYVAGNNEGSTLCVIDTSGSMNSCVSSGMMQAIDVAHSLGIYFSERLSGPFKDKFISFSNRPQYVDLSRGKSLCDKLKIAYSYSEFANTDIYKTFMLVLDTAIKHNLKQEDLPSNLLIVSDMNFDAGTYWSNGYDASSTALMQEIASKFAEKGYQMPRCVYWNVIGGYGRKAPIPVQQSKNGVALISGFSPAIAQMVFSAKTNPYDVLVDALNVERYLPIEDAFNSCEK